jgi:serine/threonine-protein kinase RsbW
MDKPVVKANKITIPSSEEYLVDVDDFLEKLLAKYGIDKSVIADIAISVTEVVINGIIHGNKSDLSKSVSMVVEKSNSSIKVIVTDEGGGFNPDEIENPLEEKNLMKEVGRGIFIVKSLMDKVVIEPSAKGTRFTLIKNI